MQNSNEDSVLKLERSIGFSFNNKELPLLALTHPSWSGEQKRNRTESNQRLEFLGDAVLELVVSDYLYFSHPDIEEGELTRMRASLVCEAALCYCAEEIGLGECLLLGKGENSSGGREKPSILSDAFEAVIGAVYLDGGFDAARKHIQKYVLGKVEEFAMLKDGKSLIQELIQRDSSSTMKYETEATGKPEEPNFRSVLFINGEAVSSGEGRTKKAAEQKAALAAVKLYQKG